MGVAVFRENLFYFLFYIGKGSSLLFQACSEGLKPSIVVHAGPDQVMTCCTSFPCTSRCTYISELTILLARMTE